MSEQKSDSTQPAKVEVVNTSRRRLTTAALAGPVVLGTLASKHALGAVSYNCTVSGQVSGNDSPGGPHSGDCSQLGLSPGCWKQTHTVWPNNAQRSVTFQSVFGYTGFGDATLIQVLCTQSYSCDPDTNPMESGGFAPLGRAAVANYLNAAHFGAPAYFPLTTDDVIEMFNAATVSDPLPVQTQDPLKTTLWYFTMLYGGTTSNVDGGAVACPIDQTQTLPDDQICTNCNGLGAGTGGGQEIGGGLGGGNNNQGRPGS